MDCIFCRIANGEIPTKIITETNHSIAFLDAFPLTKGHTLVIPKKHHEKIQNMSSTLLSVKGASYPFSISFVACSSTPANI